MQVSHDRSHGCRLLTGEPPKFALISVPAGHGAERRGCPGAGAPTGGTHCTAAPEDRSPPKVPAPGEGTGNGRGQRPRGLPALRVGLFS